MSVPRRRSFHLGLRRGVAVRVSALSLPAGGVGVVPPYPRNGTDRYLCAISGQLISVIRSAISGLFIRRKWIVAGQQGSRHAAVQRGLHHQESQCRRRHHGRGVPRACGEPFGREEPGPVQGPSHAREVVGWLRAQFPDLEMTIESIVADTDMVAVRVRSAGTNFGKLGGFAPPTNKRFVAEQSHWYRVAGGKLCEHWVTRDDLAAMLQMGVIHPPGQPRAG
jgi:predicted ester cyclase